MGGEKRKSASKKDVGASKKKKESKKNSSTTINRADTTAVRDLIPYPKPVDGSSFTECTARLTVTLAPVHSQDPWVGIYETLNNMLLRFVPQVRGVVLSYSKVKSQSKTALIMFDSPYSQLDISAKLLLWRPTSGMTLKGQINVQSPDHIGLLLWDTFNASIPASFIPKEKFEWRPFNDNEIASRAGTVANQDTDENTPDTDQDKTAMVPDVSASTGVNSSADQYMYGTRFGSGEWVYKGTSQCVGTDGCVEFVVVDVIRANEVLSVTGALR